MFAMREGGAACVVACLLGVVAVAVVCNALFPPTLTLTVHRAEGPPTVETTQDVFRARNIVIFSADASSVQGDRNDVSAALATASPHHRAAVLAVNVASNDNTDVVSKLVERGYIDDNDASSFPHVWLFTDNEVFVPWTRKAGELDDFLTENAVKHRVVDLLRQPTTTTDSNARTHSRLDGFSVVLRVADRGGRERRERLLFHAACGAFAQDARFALSCTVEDPDLSDPSEDVRVVVRDAHGREIATWSEPKIAYRALHSFLATTLALHTTTHASDAGSAPAPAPAPSQPSAPPPSKPVPRPPPGPTSEHVQQVTPASWDNFVNTPHSFLMLGSSKCHHCVVARPDFENVAAILATELPHVRFGYIDLANHGEFARNLASEGLVKQIPAFWYFTEPSEAAVFASSPSQENLLAFVRNVQEPANV